MKKLAGVLLFLITFSLLNTGALSLSIGIAPPADDLGVVNRGEKYITDFYLITDYEKDLMADLELAPIGSGFLDPRRVIITYEFVPEECSEEDITKWIKLIENPVLLKPEKKGYLLKDGKHVNANKRVSAIIEIPEDADPGYHAAFIEPSPRITLQTTGLGSTMISVARLILAFRVSGQAVRSGFIEGFESQRTDLSTERININFRNNGTTTLIVKAKNLGIYRGEELLKTVSSNFAEVRPGKTVSLIANLNVRYMEPGEYRIAGTVSWTTGQDAGEGTITIHEPPAVPVGKIIGVPEGGFPYWVIFLGLIIIGLLMLYRLKK